MGRVGTIAALCLLATLAFCAAASHARAEPAEEARVQMLEGRRLLNEGNAGAALEHFRKAFDLFEGIPRATDAAWVRSMVADCLERLGRGEDALEAHRDALGRMRAALGTGDHPQIAVLLFSLGRFLIDWGRLPEAIPVMEERLGLLDRLGRSESEDYATTLNGLAFSLYSLNRFEEAKGRYEELVSLCEGFGEPGRPLLANAASNLASCLSALGSYREALVARRRSVELYSELGGEEGPELAGELRLLSVDHFNLGELSDAEKVCKRALRMLRKAHRGPHLEVAAAWNTMGSILDGQGRFEEALECLEQGLRARRELLGEGHPEVASSLSNTAACLGHLGRTEEALAMQREALAIRQRAHPGDHPEVAASLNNLASSLLDLGRPVDALVRYEQALEMNRRLYPNGHPDIARSLGNLAVCLESLGREETAMDRLREALLILRPMGDGELLAATLVNLASLHTGRGEPEKALPLFDEALAVLGRVERSEGTLAATALNNRGNALLELGRVEEARAAFEKAYGLRVKLYPEGQTLRALSMANLGTVLIALGKESEGYRLLATAWGEADRDRSPQAHLLEAQLGYAEILLTGDYEKAARLFAGAIAQIESLRSGAQGLDEFDRATYFRRMKRADPFEGIVFALAMQGKTAEALTYLERGRARSLLDLLERSRFDPLAEAERRARLRGDKAALEVITNLGREIREAEADVARCTHVLATTRSRQDLGRSKREAVDGAGIALTTAREKLQPLLRERARIAGDQVGGASPRSAEEIQRLLTGKERMLVYSLTGAGGLLFVVRPPGQEISLLPIRLPDGGRLTPESAETLVNEYLHQLVSEGRPARGLGGTDDLKAEPGAVAKNGSDLFRALVPKEVWEEVRGAGLVRIVPHGALHHLPFESLVVTPGEAPEKTRYWLDDGPAVLYGASASALCWSKARRDRQEVGDGGREILALGDPVFVRGEGPAREPPESGVLLVEVPEDSAAAVWGLFAHDVIVAYDGKAVGEYGDLRRLMSDAQDALEDGERQSGNVLIRVWRAGTWAVVTGRVGTMGVVLARGPPRDALEQIREGDPEVRRRAVERSGMLDRYGGLAPLPGTRREVEAIRDAFAGDDLWRVRVLLGEEATCGRLRALAPQARYLHLATHQLVDETWRASYSSLALTVPRIGAPGDDGFLKLIDLLLHWRDRIPGCELVVLSACETQRGHEQRDEGVFAMPWGFQYAGSPSVVASLWRVDDESTADLMADFYRRLRRAGGREKATVLNEARKALREKFPAPYFWAPFIYIGDPR